MTSRFFMAAIVGAAALTLLPIDVARADTASGLQRIDYNTFTYNYNTLDVPHAGVNDSHTELVVDMGNGSVSFRVVQNPAVALPVSSQLTRPEKATLVAILGSVTARNVFIALKDTDLTPAETTGEGVCHKAEITFEGGSTPIHWGVEVDAAAYPESHKLAAILDQIQARVSSRNPPGVNPDHFDAVKISVVRGNTGAGFSVELNAKSGSYKVGDNSSDTTVLETRDGNTASAEDVKAIQDAFAGATVADLDLKPISAAPADDGSNFTITATVDGKTYTLSGTEESLDSKYKTRVLKLIDTLKKLHDDQFSVGAEGALNDALNNKKDKS